jgi:hypothetical protein
MSFVSYLKREQYGNRPLFHGQYFDARLTDQKQGAPVYTPGEEKYEVIDHKIEQVYDPNRTTIFPRAYSSEPNHIREYRRIMNLGSGEVPTFADNIEFMIKHQMGHMYWRYFMWNFSGRESDIQDAGWLSPIDAMSDVPPSIALVAWLCWTSLSVSKRSKKFQCGHFIIYFDRVGFDSLSEFATG